MTWEAEITSGAWFAIGPTSGGNGGAVTVSTGANPTESPRTGAVRISATDVSTTPAIGSPRTIQIIQSSSELSLLSVTPSTPLTFGLDPDSQAIAIANAGGGTLPYRATVALGASWLGITGDVEGIDSGSVTASFAANSTGKERIGVVRVLATDVPETAEGLERRHLFPGKAQSKPSGQRPSEEHHDEPPFPVSDIALSHLRTVDLTVLSRLRGVSPGSGRPRGVARNVLFSHALGGR